MKLRLALLALLVVGLAVAAHLTGLREALSTEALSEAVTRAGAWGLALFFAAFVAGQLLQVPGIVFIVAARALWGPAEGFALAYLGALLSAGTSFALVRAVGGTPLGEVRWGPARRVLGALTQRPVATVAALRAMLLLSPQLNYALALSPVAARQHLLGSAVGLVAPIAAVIVLAEGALAVLAG